MTPERCAGCALGAVAELVDGSSTVGSETAILAEVAALACACGERAPRVPIVSATTAPCVAESTLAAFARVMSARVVVTQGGCRATGAARESDGETRHYGDGDARGRSIAAALGPVGRGGLARRLLAGCRDPMDVHELDLPPPALVLAPPASTVRVIAIASGKGGVGKTNIAANLAVTLARRGARVWLLDADLGLANVDVLYGLRPTRTLEHVLRGEERLADVAAMGPAGVRLVPAARGVAELTALTPAQQVALLAEVDALDGDVDVLLVDVAAGIASNVLYFASAAAETLVVTTPEPTALADAYALVKVLAMRHGRETFPVLVNMAASEAEARAVFGGLSRVVGQFLPVRLEWAGWIPMDDAVPRAVRARTPVVVGTPGAPASRAIVALADRLMADVAPHASGGLQFFFRRLLGIEGGA